MPDTGKDILTIYCNCSYYDFIPEKTRKSVFQALTDAGVEFETVPDLCLLAARRDPVLQKWAKSDKIRIIACFPRAVRWLFNTGGVELPENAEFFNMRTSQPDEIIENLLLNTNYHSLKLPRKAESNEIYNLQFTIYNHSWVPWFPVVDYDRCINCKQCMNFCLFGVYGLSKDGKVEVQKPSSCKTNCPACARVCPHTAIIFPKYSDSPINGGEISEQSTNDNQASDLSGALQGNVYDAIRRRSNDNKRFSTNSEDKMSADSPISLNKLQKDLKIPNEVLSSLSPAEIMKLRAKSQKDTNITKEYQ
jgi:NAD-dependent dihydropyrimidine dehydrogenase PreA subunit